MAWIVALLLLAMAGTAGDALAEEPGPAVVRAHLEISADQDCATFASIAAEVAERSNRIAFVGSTASVPTLRGKIRRSSSPSGGVIAELTVIAPTGRQSRRQLAAPTCEEAAVALALLVAMTLDPAVAQQSESKRDLAGTGSEDNDTSASRTGDGHASAGEAPRNTSVASPPEAISRASTEKPSTSSALAPDSESPPQPARLSSSLGLLGSGMLGPTPQTMIGVVMYGFLAFDRTSPLSLALRLTAAHHWHGDVAEPGGTARFSLDVASLDLCALRLTVGPLSSRACASGRLGRLSASGADTYDGQSHHRLFASTGGAVLVVLALPAALELTAEADLEWTLTRDKFAFSPQVFHQAERYTLTLALAIGWRFR